MILGELASTRPASVLFVHLGALTASWDVVGVDLVGRTLKLTTLAFLIAVVWRVVDDPSAVRWSSTPPRYRVATAFLIGLLAWMFVRSLVTDDGVASLLGFAAQLVPAGAPFVAVILHRRHAAALVRTFVIGMAVSSALAVYEFVARSNRWFWLTDYRARFGGTPRSASLAYEAAYFAAPALVALILALCWWQGRVWRVVFVVVFAAGIVVANARIVAVQVVVALVVFAVLAVVMQGSQRARLVRGLGITAALGVGSLAMVWIAAPNVLDRIGDRVASIFDPDEVTSNSPRLEANERVGRIIADNPVIGIGPGRLGAEFEARGFVDDAATLGDAAFVTNNVWTQTLVDGGSVALLLKIGFLVAVAARTRRDLEVREAAVLTGWATLVLAAGFTVSNFWDTEPWLLLGCYLALTGWPRPGSHGSDDGTPRSRTSSPGRGEQTVSPGP